ncbi:MAG: putative toxin-antitoxin system toxin component, PIN family [Gemmatimonadota bacterium]|nr:putative toxin-antitoxin system toxin component, PIN family [Gemmatimonadota bacterium]MDE2785016.1 putative toxin-antitoxin system toxin component, PIN family [Gemmatimonadota bacterium]
MRVFLDTNVLVSALATRGICADVLQVVVAEHTLIVSETVLGEFRRVLRDKLAVPVATVESAEAFLRRQGLVIERAPALGIEVRDPDDVAVLEQAIAGEADMLVTGDRDLLEIDGDIPIRIVSPRGLWQALRSEIGRRVTRLHPTSRSGHRAGMPQTRQNRPADR